MAVPLRACALPLVLSLASCSLLAPSDDELLGGSGTGGASSGGGGGGSGGTTAGGSSGTGAAGSGGSSAGSGGAPTGGGGAPTGGGGAPTGGGGAPNGGGGAPNGGGGAPTGGGGAPSGGGSGGTCSVGDATPLARATFLFMDHSNSMGDAQKFQIAASGVNAFATNGKTAGIDFALQYFGLGNATCAGAGYSTPAVGFGALPGLASAVSTSLAAQNTVGQTVLEGPFNAGKTVGTQYVTSKPGTQFDVVLVTDVTQTTTGGGCSANVALLSTILSSAWPQVTTHFIGVGGASKPMLDGYASAGGSVAAQVLPTPTAASVESALVQAVTQCRYTPPNGSGKVSYTLSLGITTAPLGKALSASQCSEDAWFDHAGHVVLCPTTCQKLASSSNGKLVYSYCP